MPSLLPVAPAVERPWTVGERPFLRDLVIVLAASLPILFVFQKLRVPAIVAFLFTGILIGPHALGLVGDSDQVRKIA